MNTLTELERRKIELQSAAVKETERHEKTMKAINGALKAVKAEIAQHGSGLDVEKIQLAETVVQVGGQYTNGGKSRQSVIEDAIREFLSGGGTLHRERFGTKDYAHWSGQRCDCSYGFGPRHGSIVFSVGIVADRRKTDLTPDEIEAAVYYIRNLKEMQAAKAVA